MTQHDKKNPETEKDLEKEDKSKSEPEKEPIQNVEKVIDPKEDQKMRELVKNDPDVKKVMEQLKKLDAIEKPKDQTKEDLKHKDDNSHFGNKKDHDQEGESR